MKKFYDHLIEVESITVELDKLDLDDKERMHLASLIDASLHQLILDAILSQLKDEDKRVFVQHLSENDHEKIWKFLNGKVDNIEDRIRNAAKDLKEQLHKDIKEASVAK